MTSLVVSRQREAEARQRLEALAEGQREQMVELLLSCDSANLFDVYQTIIPDEKFLRPVFEKHQPSPLANPSRQSRLAAMLLQPEGVGSLAALTRRLTDLHEVRFIAHRLLPYRQQVAPDYWQSMHDPNTSIRTFLARATALAVWAPDDNQAWAAIAPKLAAEAFDRQQGKREIEETIMAFYPVRQHLLPHFVERFRMAAPTDSYPATLYAGMIDRDYQRLVESSLSSDSALLENMPALLDRSEEAMACLTSLMRLNLRLDRNAVVPFQARCAIAMIRLRGSKARAWSRLRSSFRARPVLIQKMHPLGVSPSALCARLQLAIDHFPATPSNEGEKQIAAAILEILTQFSLQELSTPDSNAVARTLARIQNSPDGSLGATGPELRAAARSVQTTWELQPSTTAVRSPPMPKAILSNPASHIP